MIARRFPVLAVLITTLVALAGCGSVSSVFGGEGALRAPSTGILAPAPVVASSPQPLTPESPNYRLGPGENIQIFVWRAPELSTVVPIRPDGRFSMPLVEDLPAAGKTPTELARDIEDRLKAYVQDPIVTVIAQVNGAGDPRQQVKVLGQAVNPSSLSYRSGLTALDVVIAVGGLTEFADGNRAVLVREENGQKVSYRLRLDDLVRKGDIAADRPLMPGDTIIIPESWL